MHRPADHAMREFSSPSFALLGLEPVRAAFEYIGARWMDRRALPLGDGHPVMLFPGLAADAACMAPLKSLCEELGYDASDWGRGLNAGPAGEVGAWIDGLAADVAALAAQRQRAVSLIGWSLGGLYAREIAHRVPGSVRQVITLGSPIAGEDGTNVGWLLRLVGVRPAHADPALAGRLPRTPPVPTSSIYSRSDGVVAWQACQDPLNHPAAENIEVEASHVGLVWHPAVWATLADRLAQSEGGWRPYRATPSPLGRLAAAAAVVQ